jgi:hypothetical protein
MYSLFLGKLLWLYRSNYCERWLKGKCVYAFSGLFPRNEYYDTYRFIGKHGVVFHSFEASLKYKQLAVQVLYDLDFPYVIHGGKKLYFPPQMPESEIIHMYRSLSAEQDMESPHRYVKSYAELQGKVLLDIGAAEGIFALDTIEYVEKVYLFECEEKWIQSLEKTFAPWKQKIEIVEKYVGDIDRDQSITLDSFLSGKETDNLHIKMDIEGAEQSALRGAKTILANGNDISFSVCTYHKKEDAKEISHFFHSLGYAYEFTQGYLCLLSMAKAICRGHKPSL